MKKDFNTIIHETGHAVMIWRVLRKKHGRQKAIRMFKDLNVRIIIFSYEVNPKCHGKTKFSRNIFEINERTMITYGGLCAEYWLYKKAGRLQEFEKRYNRFYLRGTDIQKIRDITDSRRDIRETLEGLSRDYLSDKRFYDAILEYFRKHDYLNREIQVYPIIKDLLK